MTTFLTNYPPAVRRLIARAAQQESAQAVYAADIEARGVVAVVAPHVPSQRRAG